MLRAKAKGKHIGRPPVDQDMREKIATRVAEVGIYTAAMELAIDPKTAVKYAMGLANRKIDDATARAIQQVAWDYAEMRRIECD